MEDSNIGKKLGNYRIVRFIGEGGMSRVYEGKHEKFERRCAIKVLIPELTIHASVRWRFENEARVMDKLNDCRDIINVIDFYEEDNFLAIIMEMLEGETLKDRIKKGAMDDASVKQIFPRVLDAFKYAHDKNIVHRDVKPSNIFLLNNGEIRVLDFGIAKINDSKEDYTSTGAQMGTTIYMSPEQVLDSKHLDYRSDIYSLGVMLYHCLTGHSPYNTETVSRFEIQSKIVNEPLAKLENIPEPYRSIIKRSTAKKPGDRYQGCEEMKHAIIEAKIKKAEKANSDKTVLDDGKVYNKEAEKKSRAKKDDEKTELYVENVVKKEEKKKRTGLYFGLALAVLAVLVVIVLIIKFGNGSQPAAMDTGPVFEMVNISGGTFLMGTDEGVSNDEEPAHSVTVSSFYLGKYEVTQKQWSDVMEYNLSYFKGCDNCPVESVSWIWVQDFIRKLNEKTGENYRLPTEAEWEYAARGGNKSGGFTNSGSNTIDDIDWYEENSGDKTHPVGQKQANELGLYDMGGNVSEWCSDWYDSEYFKFSPSENPEGPSDGSNRVIRGGNWLYSLTWVTNRSWDDPLNSSFHVGFRLARTE